MMETYEEARMGRELQILRPRTSSLKGYNGRSREWEIALRRVFLSVEKDSPERVIMLIEAQSRPITELDKKDFLSYLKAAQGIITFGMMVDKKEMQIYAIYSANLSEPICTLKVVDVLCHYDP